MSNHGLCLLARRRRSNLGPQGGSCLKGMVISTKFLTAKTEQTQDCTGQQFSGTSAWIYCILLNLLPHFQPIQDYCDTLPTLRIAFRGEENPQVIFAFGFTKDGASHRHIKPHHYVCTEDPCWTSEQTVVRGHVLEASHARKRIGRTPSLVPKRGRSRSRLLLPPSVSGWLFHQPAPFDWTIFRILLEYPSRASNGYHQRVVAHVAQR